MIDEKELIERLETSKHFLFHDECGRQTISIDKIIDLLKNAEKVGEWIPVSERLPDVDEYILVSFENFSVPMIGRYTVDDDDGGTFRVGDEDDSFVQHDLYVNAWQPLPEPYREESAE